MFERFVQRKLVYSGHSREQMARRGITEEDVEAALETADTTYPGSDRKRENLVKVGTTREGRRLKVVTKRRRQNIIVTAYWAE